MVYFQLDWPAGPDPMEAAVITMNGGSSSWSGGVLTVSSGTNQMSGAGMQGRFPILINGKESVACDFTAMFDAGATAGTMQFAGLGDGEHGVFVGYCGSQFGVRLLLGGALQYYTLQIGAAATQAGTLTFTINGLPFSYNLSAGQSAASILYTIASDPMLAACNFQTRVVNNTVVINTALAGVTSAPPTVSAGGTGCASTLAQTVSGQAPVDQWVFPAQWNGPGLEKASTLSWFNGNTFRVRLSPLGFGTIDVFVMNPDSLQYTLLHTFNRVSSPQSFSFVALGLLPSLYSCNFSAGQVVSVRSTGFLVAGADESSVIRPKFAASSLDSGLQLTGTPTSTLFLQNLPVLNGARNCSIVRLDALSVCLNPSVAVSLTMYKDPRMTSVMSAGPVDSTSCTAVDTTTSAAIVANSGYLLRTWVFTPNTPVARDLGLDDVRLEPGSCVVFCVSTTATYAQLNLGLTLTWNQP